MLFGSPRTFMEVFDKWVSPPDHVPFAELMPQWEGRPRVRGRDRKQLSQPPCVGGLRAICSGAPFPVCRLEGVGKSRWSEQWGPGGSSWVMTVHRGDAAVS